MTIARITTIQVYQEGPVRINPIAKFTDAGMHPAMLRNVELCRYEVPTPIQKYCIPAIKQGYDMIAIAQTGESHSLLQSSHVETDRSLTGSGKTAAYLIPILDQLMGKAKQLTAPRSNPDTFNPGVDRAIRAEPLVVVVCPCRELAVQIFNEARKFCYRSMLRPCVVYGGGPVLEQIKLLQKGCDILIATPGRLIDIMDRPDALTLRRLRFMVIDEADEMLKEDWSQDFGRILSGGGK